MELLKSSANAAIQSDFNYEGYNDEVWAADAQLIVPLQSSQMLMYESAAILGVEAYLKMNNLPYTIVEKHNAGPMSPNKKVPIVRCGPYMVSEIDGIVQLASTKNISLTTRLTSTEKSDLRAYISLVHNVLGNALVYYCWLDDNVYNNVTKHRVASPFNFPLSWVVPWDTRKQVKTQLTTLKWAQKDPDEVFNEVETCLTALSERLGKLDYFFGSTPTELDALVFGYLFTLLTTTVLTNSAQLRNLVKQRTNLLTFCDRLEKQYFGSEGQEE